MSLFGPPNIENMKRKRDIKGLIKALSYKKDGNIANSAEKALIEIKPSIEFLISPLRKATGYEKVKILSIFREIVFAPSNIKNPLACETLLVALKDKDQDVRRYSAITLGEIKDPRGVEPLISVLKDISENMREDISEWVRVSAVEALAKIKDPRAIEPLAYALKDRSKNVQLSAAIALSEFKDPRALEPLEVFLSYSNGSQVSAAIALSEFKDPRAVEPILNALEEGYINEYSERENAFKALCKIKDPRAMKTLVWHLYGDCSDELYEIITTSLCEFNDPCLEKILLEAAWIENNELKAAWIRKGKHEDFLKLLGIPDPEKYLDKLKQIIHNRYKEASHRKAPTEEEFIERIKQSQNEIGDLTFELIDIGKSYGFLSQPGERFDMGGKNIRAREIGTRLDQIGGIKLMREVFYHVAKNFKPGSSLSKELEVAWHRIGDWQC